MRRSVTSLQQQVPVALEQVQEAVAERGMTQFPDDERYDLLVLTLGGNPVPLALTIDACLAPKGKVIILTTKGATRSKKGLEEWANQRKIDTSTWSFREVDPGDPSQICDRLQLAMADLNPQHIALDYTGGTKAMSANALLSALELFGNLDSIYVDPRNGTIARNKREKLSVGETVYYHQPHRLTVEDFGLLHCVPIISKDDCIPFRDEWVWLATKPQSTSLVDIRVFMKDLAFTSKDRSLNHINVSPGAAAFKSKIIHRCATTLNVQSRELTRAHITEYLKSFKFTGNEPREWIGSKWLETFARVCLMNCGVSIVDSFTAVKPAYGGTTFDLDAVASLGNSLAVISCGTQQGRTDDGFDELKKKLFEVNERAKQLGGSEAKIGLATGADDRTRELLQAHIETLIDRPNIRVFALNEFNAKSVGEWLKA